MCIYIVVINNIMYIMLYIHIVNDFLLNKIQNNIKNMLNDIIFVTQIIFL